MYLYYLFTSSKYVDHLQMYKVFEATRMKELIVLFQRPNVRIISQKTLQNWAEDPIPGERHRKSAELSPACRFRLCCSCLFHTVDGSEIRRSPVEVGSLSHDLQGFIHPRWAGFPSTVVSTWQRAVVCSSCNLLLNRYLFVCVGHTAWYSSFDCCESTTSNSFLKSRSTSTKDNDTDDK